MSIPSILVLARHGQSQTQVGKKGRYFTQEERDTWETPLADRQTPLSEAGLEHAVRVGRALKDRYGVFDLIWHSDYVRNEQTARAFIECYTAVERGHVQLRGSPLLRERDYGYLFGLTADEVAREHPGFDAYHDAVGQLDFRWPGGESLLPDVYARVMLWQVQQHISGAWTDKRILVVGSWGSLLMMRYVLENWSDQNFWENAEKVSNCCVTVYEANGRSLELRSENHVLCS